MVVQNERVANNKRKIWNDEVKWCINNTLKILYTNVDGLVSKLMEVRDLIREKKPQVVCLTETKLRNSITNDTLGFENYNVWRKDREGKQGGGVIILTNDKLQAKQIQMNNINKVEMVAVEVKAEEDVIIGNIYMPPVTSTTTWEEDEYYKALIEDTAQTTIRMLLQRIKIKE